MGRWQVGFSGEGDGLLRNSKKDSSNKGTRVCFPHHAGGHGIGQRRRQRPRHNISFGEWSGMLK
jgi:hypothetical protein